MSALNKELAAEVLLTAIFTTDEQACQKYGVSLRSLQRWRRQLADGDPELAGSVATKKAAFNVAWAENLPAALARGVQALEKCFTEIHSDPRLCKNPVVLHALAGAFRIVAEVQLTSTMIDARLGKVALPINEESGFPN
jgi:transposase-like protein